MSKEGAPFTFAELESEFGEVFGSIVWNTMGFEGYESDDPEDKGGYTRYGFASATHGKDNLPETPWEAAQRYHDEYWERGLAYPVRVQEHPPLAAQVFDFAVTSGPSGAAKTLQFALNQAFPEDPPLLVDGWTGPATVARVRKAADYWERNGGWWCPALTIFKSMRTRHYTRYQETRSTVVVRGLLKRLDISTAMDIRTPEG